MKRLLIFISFLGFLVFTSALSNSYAEVRGVRNTMKSGFLISGGHMAPPIEDNFTEGIPRGMHHIWMHLESLDLDEKQKADIKGIHARFMKSIIKKRADIQIANVELRELLDKEPIDMMSVKTKLTQIETMKTEAFLSHIKAKEEVKSKLTPEQLKKLKEGFNPLMKMMMKGGMKTPLPPCYK